MKITLNKEKSFLNVKKNFKYLYLYLKYLKIIDTLERS